MSTTYKYLLQQQYINRGHSKYYVGRRGHPPLLYLGATTTTAKKSKRKQVQIVARGVCISSIILYTTYYVTCMCLQVCM